MEPPFWRRNCAQRTRQFRLGFFGWNRRSYSASGKSHQGACFDVICSIRAGRRRCSWHSHVGSGAGADTDAPVVNDTPVVNVVQGRRRLQMDIEAMESGKGQVGQGKRKMGRLPEAVQGPKSDRPKELVIHRILYDQLTNLSIGRRLR